MITLDASKQTSKAETGRNPKLSLADGLFRLFGLGPFSDGRGQTDVDEQRPRAADAVEAVLRRRHCR